MPRHFRNECDAAVIGAGAAGIAAARSLAAAGIDVQLIEARQRPGGRAFTQIHDGHALDLGCGWLHSANENPYVNIARAHGFTVDETPPPWQQMMLEDAFAAQDQKAFRQAQMQLYSRLERGALEASDRPAADFLEPGMPWNPLIDAVSTYVNGCALTKLSTKDFDRYHDSEINFRITEGYGALIAHLAKQMPVIYDCPVNSIDHHGQAIAIATARGVLKCRAVILAVPANIIASGALKFSPELAAKQEAAAMLPLGIANKVFLRVEHAGELPDNGRIFGKTDRTDTGAYHLLPFGRPVIEGYFGGDCARELEQSGLAGFADFAIGEICGMLGSQWRRRLSPLAASAWAGDPFALGSYSHALPGHWDKRAVLASPIDNRIFFAGEATSPHFFSTAHGAHESGLRAAAEVMAALAD